MIPSSKQLGCRHCTPLLFLLFAFSQACQDLRKIDNPLPPMEKEVRIFVDKIMDVDSYSIVPGITIERTLKLNESIQCASSRSFPTLDEYFRQRFHEYIQSHSIQVRVPETARMWFTPVDTGKSSFMAGFGMGFLAFALKKLLLPVFIGAQIIKSVLIALFLPSILGSVGKLLGKGLSTFSGTSGASGGLGAHPEPIEDFEFKDTSPYHTDGEVADVNAADTNYDLNGVATSSTSPTPEAMSRFGFSHNKRISSHHSDNNYYFRKPSMKTDYKVFHKIPPSSLLLTTYDPFYSPLLSRMDAVFQQLGLGNDKSPQTELCRERLVCLMYANPAKYAPYSNLVSAQLSRELNDLRKPSSDNPEILRFFRYMKAAKDGQDGKECLSHGGCPSLTSHQPSPAMLTTFNDINKLVQARKLK